MSYEVIVVGAGIGGLTTAALLAARGVNVCLLEKQSQPGGCVTAFEKFGYTFESGAGLYPLWQPGEIHDRIFSELPVDPPEVRLIEPSYVVRLPDQSDIAIKSDSEAFNDALRSGFPECPDQAIAFIDDPNHRPDLAFNRKRPPHGKRFTWADKTSPSRCVNLLQQQYLRVTIRESYPSRDDFRVVEHDQLCWFDQVDEVTKTEMRYLLLLTIQKHHSRSIPPHRGVAGD